MKKIITTLFFAITGIVFSQTSPQTYSVPGNFTFTVPASVSSITVEIVGGGGSGGGNGTGGGGGGAYAKGVYNVTPNSTLAVQVGFGGMGIGPGTSSVGGFISATGGGNGVSVSNPMVGGGGTGGISTGGTISNNFGAPGGGGYYTYFGGGGGGAGGPLSQGTAGGNVMAWTGSNCLQPGGTGGAGGGAPGGNGGKGSGFIDNSCNTNDPSVAGGNFGAGGGGGNGNSGPGSAGAGGYCQISFNSCTLPGAPLSLAAGSSICANNSKTFTAVSSSTINWYSTPTSTVSLSTGATYVTPTLSAGTYSFYAAATNTCGEGPRATYTVLVHALPTVSISSSAPAICIGQTVSLTASGANSYTWNTGSNAALIIPSLTVTTSYTVNGTDANSCKNTYTFTQIVNALPTVSISSSASLICNGQTASLTASGATSYTWNTASNATVIAVTPTTTTSYTVNGTDVNNCANSFTITQNVAACTGITQNAINESIKIYPNPNKGDFIISANSEMNLSLINNLGQLVKAISINAANGYKASVTDLPNGIYFITDNSNRNFKQKIIVSK